MTLDITKDIIKKSYFWTAFKSIAVSKSLSMQYDEDAFIYFIYAYDGTSPTYVHSCTIYKGTVPDGVLVSYSQGQNDSDKTDFETNFKANANYVNLPTTSDNSINSKNKNPVLAARANTSAPTWTDGYMVPLSVDTSGAVRVTGSISASNPSVSSNNSAIPASSTQVGGSDGTNLQAIRVFDVDTGGGTQYVLGVGLRKASSGGSVELGTSSDPIRIDPVGTTTQPVSGTVTANQGGTWNITNISGTVSLPTGAATEASLVKLTLAQGSTTSGQTGLLNLGAVTTAAPSYTTGQSSPLSLDTSGALRVTGSISASNPSVSTTGATPPASATYIGGSVTTAAPTYTTGQMNALSLDTSGALRITGSISASNPSVGTNNAAIPTSSTQIGGSDGTNLRSISTTTAGVVKVELQAVTSKEYYSASIRGINPGATPTDIFTITGSDTKIARVLRIILSATQTTGASQEFLIIKRSSLNGGGTSVPFVPVAYSSTFAPGTITIRAYTAKPAALGTSLGNMRAVKFFVPATSTAQTNDYIFDFTNSGLSSGIVLNANTDVLAVNFNGAALPAGLTLNCSVEWSEE
jgi:hypothetical protein